MVPGSQLRVLTEPRSVHSFVKHIIRSELAVPVNDVPSCRLCHLPAIYHLQSDFKMLPCGHQTSTCSIHICKVNSCPDFKLMPLLRVPLKMTDNGGRRRMFHVSARLKECR